MFRTTHIDIIEYGPSNIQKFKTYTPMTVSCFFQAILCDIMIDKNNSRQNTPIS